MDPNETLRQARAVYQETLDMYGKNHDSDVLETALEALSAFEALDDWMSKGGFLPEAWASEHTYAPDLLATAKRLMEENKQ